MRNFRPATLVPAFLAAGLLTACGIGVSKANLLQKTKEKIASTEAAAAKAGYPDPLLFCQDILSKDQLPPDGGTFYSNPFGLLPHFYFTGNFEKVFSDPAKMPIVTGYAGDVKSMDGDFQKMFSGLLADHLVKIVKVDFHYRDPHDQEKARPMDLVVWTGPRSDIKTKTYHQFYYSHAKKLQIESLTQVTSFCGGSLEPIKISQYTKPAANSSGTTVTKADMTFSYGKLPAWMTDKAVIWLRHNQPVMTTTPKMIAGWTKAVQVKLAKTYPGSVTFENTSKGWMVDKMDVPMITQKVEAEDMNNIMGFFTPTR